MSEIPSNPDPRIRAEAALDAIERNYQFASDTQTALTDAVDYFRSKYIYYRSLDEADEFVQSEIRTCEQVLAEADLGYLGMMRDELEHVGQDFATDTQMQSAARAMGNLARSIDNLIKRV